MHGKKLSQPVNDYQVMMEARKHLEHGNSASASQRIKGREEADSMLSLYNKIPDGFNAGISDIS
jgi:hypothetical protein